MSRKLPPVGTTIDSLKCKCCDGCSKTCNCTICQDCKKNTAICKCGG